MTDSEYELKKKRVCDFRHSVVAELGNPNSITDVGVGAQIAFVGVIGGIYNVLINLKEIKDEEFKSKMKKDCANLKLKAERELKEITEIVEEKLS